MKVLVLGGSGFVGSHIVGKLIKNRYQVDIGCRSTKKTQKRFPDCKVHKVNYQRMTTIESWMSLIKGYDVVINAVGIFESTTFNSIENVQYEAPVSLAKAFLNETILNNVEIIVNRIIPFFRDNLVNLNMYIYYYLFLNSILS